MSEKPEKKLSAGNKTTDYLGNYCIVILVYNTMIRLFTTLLQVNKISKKKRRFLEQALELRRKKSQISKKK